MRWSGLRFGLLGPPVLFDRLPQGTVPYDTPADERAVYDADARTRDTGDRRGSGPAPRTIGSPKVRALFAALLLEAGRVVSVDALKDALWRGAPPASAHASLHNHVTRLRRLLDDPERLRAVPPGYVLRVDEGELDVHVFDTRVTEARAAHGRRDWAGVLRACAAALALWRGRPLSGLPTDLGGYAFAQRLEEARLLLLEWRYDAELAVGGTRLAGLVPELAALVAEHPLREAYHRQLMLALHHTGRQAEALAVHRDLRSRLVEELGIEPGPAVREAHVEVLRGHSPPADTRNGTDAWSGAAGRSGADVQSGGDVQSGWGARGRADTRSGTDAWSGADTRGGADTGRSAGDQAVVDAPSAVDGRPPADVHAPPHGPPAPVESLPHPPDGASEPSRTPTGDAPSGDAPTGSTPTGDRPPPRPVPAQLPPPPAHFTGRTSERQALAHVLRRSGGPTVALVTGMAGVGKSALALEVAHELRERFPDGQLYVNLHGATPGMTPLAPAQALAALLRDLGTEPRAVPERPDAAAALLRSLLAPTRTLMVLDDAESAAQVRPLLPGGDGCAVIVTSRSPLTALDGARRFPLTPLSCEDSAALLRAVSGRAGVDAAHPLVELTGRLPLALRVVAARLAARQALTPDMLAGQLADTGSRLTHLEYDDLSVRRSLAVAHDALAAAEREADRDAALALRGIGALDLPTYGASLMARLTGVGVRRAEAALDRLVDVALLEETAYGRYTPHDLVRDYAHELATAPSGGSAEKPGESATGPTDPAPGPADPADPAPGPPGPPGPAGGEAGSVDGVAVSAHGRAVSSGGAGARGVGSLAPDPDEEVVDPACGSTGGDVDSFDGSAASAPGRPVSSAGAGGRGEDTSAPTDPVAVADLVALRWYAAVAERVLVAIVEPGLDRDDRRRGTAAQPAEHAARVAEVAPFRCAEQAFGWGDAELENVVALVGRNVDAPDDHRVAHVSTLVRLLFPYVQRSGRVAEMESLVRAGLAAARRLGDAAAEAYALVDLARVHFLNGRQGEALALNGEALEIWRRLGVLSWIRRCLNNRGLLLEGLGRYPESEAALRQSLEYSRELNDPYGEAVTHSHLGNLYEHTDARTAIEHHRRSLAIGDEIGAVIVRYSAHCNIGYAHLTLDEPAAAARHFEESMRILGGHGDWHGESQTRLGLVRALHRLGGVERAARECAELIGRADARADRYIGGLARHQHGLLLRERGHETEAYEAWREARAQLVDTDETAVLAELARLIEAVRPRRGHAD
ncbi:BTAD domain-containing putative transcriptional regulator [Streptomyces sp. NPDC026672]|uniref:BTAD domain-containing putative transcriptional regulator n=1 Tax=unclassified Streptomyces TaxID=2593676 RepID=UPI0034099B78